MAITKISQRTLLEDFADDDEILIVDKSDPTESAETGTTKRGLLGTIRSWFGISLAGEYPDIYCDAVDGDDANPGTEPLPFATLTPALALARRSSVRSTIHLAAGDYDSEPLRHPVQPKGLRVAGAEFVELVAEMQISAYDATSRTLTVTPDPGWTTDQWRGAFVQWTDGPTPVNSEVRTKLIGENGSNTIWVPFGAYNTSGTEAFTAGNSVRIVRPAASLTGPSTSPYVGSPFSRRTDSGVDPEVHTLENLNIICSGETQTNFTGGWEWVGLRFVTSLTAAWKIALASGYLNAGGRVASTQSTRGWGVAWFNAVGSVEPELLLTYCTSKLYTVGGKLTTEGGSTFWMGGNGRDVSSAYPHGAVCSIDGGHTFTFSSTNNGRYRLRSSQSDFYTENATLEVDAPIVHQGAGKYIEARYMGNASTRREIVQEGSGAQLLAQYGGQIRLNGAGSTYGAATAGATAALGGVTRAAGAWAVGEAICNGTTVPFPKDLSNIYRSS